MSVSSSPALGPAAYRVLSRLSSGEFQSGEALAREAGVSRAAVGKAVARLRELGVRVDAVTGRGYRLRLPLELLDAERIAAGLPDEHRRALSSVAVRPSCQSTNAELMVAAREGRPAQALFAEWQSSGRGRWGRSWIAPLGRSLCLSLLYHMPPVPGTISGLSLAVGVCLGEALRALGARDVGLKWPNDLLGPAGKLGGVLIEMSGEPAGPCAVVVGVGLNLRVLDEERALIPQAVSDLADLAPDGLPGRNHLAATVLAALLRACREYADGGLEPFRSRWQEFDVYAGREVELQLPTGSVTGIARGIDQAGALRLDTGQGMLSLPSGDLRLRLRS